ncbi:MAG: hypothetical protein C0524_04800 [Rhodobacter sp.]|nr:hypothetical protein [Rhodobacter sp.]
MAPSQSGAIRSATAGTSWNSAALTNHHSHRHHHQPEHPYRSHPARPGPPRYPPSRPRSPRRFSDLRADIPLVLAKVLTQRLRELEERGILRRSVMDTTPPSVEYNLTAPGVEFMPVFRAIADVGQRLKVRASPLLAESQT